MAKGAIDMTDKQLQLHPDPQALVPAHILYMYVYMHIMVPAHILSSSIGSLGEMS